jgi:hypothetical protein
MELNIVLPAHVRDLLSVPAGGGPLPLRGRAASLRQLHAEFHAAHPRAARQLWDSAGRLHRHLLVVHNDEPLSPRDHDSVVLRPGDMLEFIVCFAGG